MVFSSVTFLFFFLPIFLVFYTLLPFRNATALIFSVLFYAWGEGVFVFVLIASVIINYIAGISICSSRFNRKRALFAGIGVNLLLLFYFKYLSFFINDVFGFMQFDAELAPHLPLGISFFTFQSISYLIDVYQNKAKPARNIWDLALYIMMFPQLIAGPIVRYATVARQIKRRSVHFNYVIHGLMFFSIGLSQKVLIANNVAGVSDGIFALPLDNLSSMLVWTGSIAYTLQIYFDFAGYSNMAIGLGLIMGFKFPHNFNYPYISQTITEFWRRWHISLSSWFRDYLYIPLGGNRRGSFITYRNLFIVFLLCGLWHGASWTFVVWGLYHGLLLIGERFINNRVTWAAPRGLKHIYVLLAIIVGWVIFRSDTFEQAHIFLMYLFFISEASESSPAVWELLNNQQLIFGVIGIIASTPAARILITYIISDRNINIARYSSRHTIRSHVLDITFAASLLFVCSVYIAAGTYNPFIYFRF